jgi:heat shock protein HtpX
MVLDRGGCSVIGVNRAKTWILIAGLAGLFVAVGAIIGGSSGATIALVIALIFNAAMYWFSGSIAIRSTRSKLAPEQEYPQLYAIVRELSQTNAMPMPEVYVSDMTQPNAFATGRNPRNAKVAVTKGILELLDERELRGVLAHELSHVANRDILVSSVAAAIGTAISYLAYMAFWFGGDDDEGGNPLVMLVAWIFAPLAAGIIQMAVSRSREFEADRGAAELLGRGEPLARALGRIEVLAARTPMIVAPAQAQAYIHNPLAEARPSSGVNIAKLFSTHPPTEERIRRLQAI